ncbi:MAG: type II toxin-antitoxin system HicA family toxin [Candidatus Nanoarchaeia archaeon]
MWNLGSNLTPMRLPQLKPRKICRAIERLGFVCVRQTGSHLIYKHSDGRFTIVPHHPGDINRRLLMKIIKQISISKEEFLKYL